MKTHGVGLAHVGRKRTTNEDCWLVDDQLGLYAVADGMGGHRAGEVAASAAIDAAASTIRAQRELLEKVVAGKTKARELGLLVDKAVQAASKTVHEQARQDTARKGMGCTLTLVLVAGRKAIMGHVGDSRLYLCRRGELHQLSRDHTYADELAAAGAIKPESVRDHPLSHVLTRSIGHDEAVLSDLLVLDLLPGDRLLLCSDGLANYVTDDAWLAKELGDEDVESIPEELVRFANDAGGADNITALVVEVEAEPDEKPSEHLQATLDALQGCYVTGGLRLARTARLLNHTTRDHHAAGSVLVTEGNALPGLTVVVQGECIVVQGESETFRLGPGDCFGATALVVERAARATVKAEQATRVLNLSRGAFRELTRLRPRLGCVLLRRIVTRQDQEPKRTALP